MGGEEFALVLPNTDLKSAAAFAEALRARIEATPVQCSPQIILRVTASLGVACTMGSQPVFDASDLLKHADQALYEAKNKGRNQVVTA